MWIARDKSNKLYLFTKKPYKKMEECDTYKWYPDCRAFKICIDSSLFPNLKWEDEPLEIEICIKL